MKSRTTGPKTFVLTLLAGLAALPAGAETLAIRNARIETAAAAGEIASGTLVITDGRIDAVGASVTVPAGARVIDAAGKPVTPGFIAPSSNLAVNEVNLVRETRDDYGGSEISAGFDVQYGVNPASTLIPVARQTGVTHAVLTPLLGSLYTGEADGHGHAHEAASLQGGGEGTGRDPYLFGGQAAIIRLDDGNENPVVRARVAVALDLGEAGASHAGGSRGATIVLVKSAFDDARHYTRNRESHARGQTRAYGLSRVDLEALVPVVEGKTPLLVRVSRASDIRQALRLAREEKIRLILEGVEEGWRLADEIAASGTPVLLDPQDDLPGSFETIAARLDNATRLERAGVLFAIKAGRGFNSLRPLRLNAGTAVAYGLPRRAALEAITINPARIWGMADRTGSIEVGKDADIVIWSGDPLETTSYPQSVFIAGVEQPAGSRRLELRDRYMAPDDGWPPAYH